MPRVCVPICAYSLGEANDLIKKSLNKAQLFELYIDYIEGINKESLSELILGVDDQCILTFRRPKFEDTRLTANDIKELLSCLGGCYVDFDLYKENESCHLVNTKEGHKVKLITSYHNYDRTPSLEELRNVILEMTRYDPQIYKIACSCQDPDDALTLMSILRELIAEGKKAVVTGMGSHGLGVRVLGGLWGSEWVYAPLEDTQLTAPGQISVNKLNELYSILSS